MTKSCCESCRKKTKITCCEPCKTEVVCCEPCKTEVVCCEPKPCVKKVVYKTCKPKCETFYTVTINPCNPCFPCITKVVKCKPVKVKRTKYIVECKNPCKCKCC
ncbi:MAG: hypothetical protein Satyrvirus18_10 [Satyrvirus sp.]|uniref:Uncharacterized protein n=1 Tax=Satyrvirus sp. TaxID=2487771 RepID=A0A3G5AI56_9VIRU|nr:MAG: hypothetical protein Satyrvirus18_10 [Satyrvirus sp.]